MYTPNDDKVEELISIHWKETWSTLEAMKRFVPENHLQELLVRGLIFPNLFMAF